MAVMPATRIESGQTGPAPTGGLMKLARSAGLLYLINIIGGAFALLLKSFRPEELRSIVEQALVKVALRRERDLLEQRYRALVEVADVIVIGLDRAGNTALVNPKLPDVWDANLVFDAALPDVGRVLRADRQARPPTRQPRRGTRAGGDKDFNR